MIVVVIIGLLAGMALVALNHTRQRAQATRITNDLRTFKTAFATYAFENNGWPPAAAAGAIPAGMEGYLTRAYLNTAEPGGAYSWSGTTGQLQFTSLSATDRVLEMVDQSIDDGNPSAGEFTRVSGTTFVLQL